ncbi:MAG: tetratricopeptide repeat protein [Phycisphaerales bacterium]
MGTGLRHVFVVSALLGAGTFVYLVGFAPMDEARFKRAGAINQTPSRAGMILSVRRAMSMGRLQSADRICDALMEQYPEEPSAYFWRATVYRQLGEPDSAAEIWRLMDREMTGLDSWDARYTQGQLDYFRAWAKVGIGDQASARALFTKIADELEAQSGGATGEVVGSGNLYNLACYRSMAGDIESAMGHWERAVELGYGQDNRWWMVDPDLEPLHGLDRFWEIGSRIDLDLSRDRRRGDGGDSAGGDGDEEDGG